MKKRVEAVIYADGWYTKYQVQNQGSENRVYMPTNYNVKLQASPIHCGGVTAHFMDGLIFWWGARQILLIQYSMKRTKQLKIGAFGLAFKFLGPNMKRMSPQATRGWMAGPKMSIHESIYRSVHGAFVIRARGPQGLASSSAKVETPSHANKSS